MITIHFEFKNHKASDLQQLNALLAAMKLSDLQLDDSDGYLVVFQDGDGNLLEKRYGLDSGTLVCKLADSEDGYCYQIDSIVTDHSVDHDTFIKDWRECHPDRVLRILVTVEFEEDIAYLIIHHQKVPA